MKIRKHINKYKIRQKLPSILTLVSCAGVAATGILSAKAMYDYISDNRAKEGEIDLERAVKVAIPPVAVGAATIGSFILCREIDKKTIAALSMATATMIEHSKECPKKRIEQKLKDPADTCVVDEDGELYFEEVSGLLIKARPSTIQEAKYKLNRNYQLRGGLASLYEFLRMIGVKKKDIRKYDAQWTEYVGWYPETPDLGDELYWIDIYEAVDGRVKLLGFHVAPMPICYDAPRYVMDICRCDEEDLEGLYLDRGENVTDQIAKEIRDEEID